MGTLFVDNIKHESAQGSGTITLGASGETVAMASGASVGAGMGKVLQAKQTIFTSGVLTTAAFPVEVPGFTLSITPISTSNKILITLDCSVSINIDYWVFAGIRRDSTDLGRQRVSPYVGHYDMKTVTMSVLDSPSSTSALTYKAVWGAHTTGGNCTFNYRPDHSNTTNGYAALTALEIAG